MAQIAFERNREHVNIGIVGHVDHGKTTLSAAITKVCAELGLSDFIPFEKIDNAPEEKKRGITIKATTVEFNTEKRHYSLTDCPGHKDYVKNMIVGAAQADYLVMLVDGDAGVMPQTKEHFLLARQVGVEKVIVFINKIDVVSDEDMLEMVEAEVAQEGVAKGFTGAVKVDAGKVINLEEGTSPAEEPTGEGELNLGSANLIIVRGSALGALEGNQKYVACIKNLLSVLDAVALPERALDKPFLMPLDGCMSITGRGTVVTGKIEKGIIKEGDDVVIISKKKGVIKTKATAIEAFRKTLKDARSGENVGVLLRGVSKEDVGRGDIVCMPGVYFSHHKFKAEVYVLTSDEGGRSKPFSAGYRPQFFFRTSDVTGDLKVIRNATGEKEIPMVMPGDNVEFEVHLVSPVVMEAGLRFTVREGGSTIGAGVVSKIIK